MSACANNKLANENEQTREFKERRKDKVITHTGNSSTFHLEH